MPDSRSSYAANHINPSKKYSCVHKCGQGKLVHSGSLLCLALCEIMWSRVMCPSSTQATQPPTPLSKLKEWTWMEHTEKIPLPDLSAADARQCVWTVVIYFLICHLLSYLKFFLWSTPPIFCLSTDNCHWFITRTEWRLLHVLATVRNKPKHSIKRRKILYLG